MLKLNKKSIFLACFAMACTIALSSSAYAAVRGGQITPTAPTNPAGQTVESMEATDQDPSLVNYGIIFGGKGYGGGIWAGMHGSSTGSTSYDFTNIGDIIINKAGDNVYGMYASADGNSSHTLTNSGTITVSGNGYVYGMYASAGGNSSHTLTNSAL